MTTLHTGDSSSRPPGSPQAQIETQSDETTQGKEHLATRSGWKSILKRAKSKDKTKNQTKGALEALCTVLENAENIRKAVICNTEVIHSATNLGDLSWGCGYRNIQMIFSSLASHDPDTFETAFGTPSDMGIADIQVAIEAAWAHGFDVEGAQQLSWKLLHTKKWIGTTEVYALLTYAGYDVTIVQFDGVKNGASLIEFCASYFGIHEPLSASRHVDQSGKHPLYFQHQGHSRTIVGCVQTKHGIELLVFDPARRISSDIKKLVPGGSTRSGLATKSTDHKGQLYRGPKWSSLLRAYLVDNAALTKKEYQVLRIDGYMTDASKEQRKIIRPLTIR